MTQAEFARALEISAVTLNRWENEDPRYKPSEKDSRSLEAVAEIIETIRDKSRSKKNWQNQIAELRDALRISTVAGVIAKAAAGGILKATTVTLLMATPGLGWLGTVAGIGIGAALPFFARLQSNKLKEKKAK
jgi:DNA-binding XRE family transcriptional regulator